MKKTQKKVFGLFGLLLVIITTIFAAFMPGPETLASPSMTNSIVVRVVGNRPNVDLIGPAESGSIFVSPNLDFSYNYEETETVIITLEYTDINGITHNFILDTIDTGYSPGSGSLDLNLSEPQYGYGEYILTILGTHESMVDCRNN